LYHLYPLLENRTKTTKIRIDNKQYRERKEKEISSPLTTITMSSSTLDNNQLWEFIQSYFRDNPQHLVQHHIHSYDHFFQNDFFRIFKENNPQTLHSEDFDQLHQNYKHSLKFYYGGKDGNQIYFGKPVIHDEDRPHIMMPNEARIRDMTYAMTIHYDVEIEYTRYLTPSEIEQLEHSSTQLEGGAIEDIPQPPPHQSGGNTRQEEEQQEARNLEDKQFMERVNEYLLEGGAAKAKRVQQNQPPKTQQATVEYKTSFTLKQIYLGRFPIMVQSSYCLLSGMSKEMRFSMGECFSDVGGYFIIDGKEKTVIPQEKFANNMLRVRPALDDAYNWSADILSVSENVSKPIRNLSVRKHAQTGQIVVLLPNVRAPIPLFIVFRALGVLSDQDIIEMCVLDMEKYQDFLPEFRPSIHDAGPIFTQRAALEYIALLTKWKQIHTAQLILADYFLPHIGETNYIQKAYYLGYMVLRLLRVHRKLDEPTDRDHFKYKRMELAGTLMSDLFREYYSLQLKRIHTAFETQLYFKGGEYDEHLDKLVTDTQRVIFQNLQLVDQGFKKAFKGNWGSQSHTKRIGIVQDLNRLSSNSALNQMRKTNLPIDPTMAKLVGPRILHGSQWGIMDPIDTPDGGNIGLHKHLSIMTHITQDISREPMLQWIRTHLPNYYLLADVLPSLLSNMTKVLVNGYWVGSTSSPLDSLEKMRLYRRNGLLPTYASISFDYRENVLYIHTDGGRMCRPVFYWDAIHQQFSSERLSSLFSNSTSTQPDEILGITQQGELSQPAFTWEQIITGFNSKRPQISYNPEEGKIYQLDELYELTANEVKDLNENKTPKRFIEKAAMVDYLDNMESEYSLINVDALSLSTPSANALTTQSNNVSTTPKTPISQNKKYQPKWTHQEIHQALNYGMMCNLAIFLENNPANRNNFSCGQSKQAVSLYHTNYQARMDKTAVVLNTGQLPLLKSRLLENINGEYNPYGVNTIVAIMCYTGYNVEDATLINEGALQRGLFKTTYMTTYKGHEETAKTANSNISLSFANISKLTNVMGKKQGYNYEKLDENGIIKEGTEIDEFTVLIGMTATDLTPGTSDTNKHDYSIVPKKGQKGVVDKVFITEGAEGQRIAKVRIRETRIPAIGDKMASRAGQKGTVGMVIPECDMPFTKSGIKPDIIINPHAIPTRMTIGHLVECIIGKSCVLQGGYGDCTAHNNQGSKIQEFGKILTALGFHSSGNEVLYDGLSGQQIEANIFMGPNYYMRLKHMVKDKINFRALGPNTALTRQPVSGRANDGGLRIGEMERDAVGAHGITAFLQESMLDRGDHIFLAICNKTGMTAIYNPRQKLLLSPMADGPVQYTGSLETGDMKLQQVTQYGREFSLVKIPYVMKLFMQEMLAIGVQMRIITEDNIQQMENMSFSHNLELLMDSQPTVSVNPNVSVKITPKDVIQKIQNIKNKLNNGKQFPNTPDSNDVQKPEPIDMSSYPVPPPYTPQSPQYPYDPNSPEYAPNSPAYAPNSPEYAPNSPAYGPNSPAYGPNSPAYDPNSPAYDPNSPKSPQIPPPNFNKSTEYKKGDLVHFRGDTKPTRLWEIVEIGTEFISIRTDDRENLDAKDNVKIVTRGDIYTPSTEYPYQSGGYIYAVPPNQYTADYSSVGGGLYQQAPPPLPTNPLPVNITIAPKLVGGDDNSKTYKESSTAPSAQTDDNPQTSGSFFNVKKIEEMGGGNYQENNEYDNLSSKSKIDFNQVVVKKMDS
jgi:DNA-directed RNA polymerase II subunit RPB2